jgi:hypothetical protein
LKRGAQLLQSSIEASLKVYVGTLRPQRLAELLSFDDFAIPLEEHCQNAKRLFLDFDANALAAQRGADQVDLKQAKFDDYG